MRHGSLFSGIGGFDLAAEWMGWENVFHCEINTYCQKILKQHFPQSITYEDIKTTGFIQHNGEIDIITGGFPCQPYSLSGKRKGDQDDRHLWPEMLRAIKEIQPRWIIGENVSGIVNWSKGLVFEQVQADLENAGFEVFPSVILPACSQGAPHERQRLWIIAYSGSKRVQFDETGIIHNEKWNGKSSSQTGKQSSRTATISESGTTASTRRNWSNWPTQSPVCRGNDGIPDRMERIKALGNAVVPHVVYRIFKTIQQYENTLREETNHDMGYKLKKI